MYATRGLHLAIHGYRLLACLILVSTSFGQQLGDVTGCICLEPYNQICGSDGITYANQCHLNCIALLTPGLQKAKNGPCQQDDTNTNFAVPDDPVLDSFSLDSLEPQQVLGSSAACDVACVGVPDEPVCGNNHKTYRNKCDLQCAATMNSDLRPGYPGACRTNCYCSARLYTPLCGSDGFTYPSRCWIRCAVKTNSNLQLKHFSACTKEDCEQRCADDGGSTPLCGSDGKVYKNRCYFRCAQDSDKSLTRELRCTSARRSNPALPPCACPNDNRPVCGTDGRTYDNECLINCAQRQDGTLHVAYAGVCKEPCECSRDYNPVCGANGKTYTNDCTFRCARDEDNELQMNHIGRCSSFFLCLCFSRANPVCASDGVTYVNTCKLNCAAQTNPDKNGLTMVHTGECPGSCVCGTQQTDRICGNDGTTYRNRCELECAAGNNPGLRVMQTGVCPCDCDNESSPVCGRDGITYNNQCEFECAKRLNTRLRLLRNGPCPCICAGDQNPVCGSDNVSYNNLCELECKINDGSVAGLQMLYEGPCHQDVCDCSNRARHLVCGNDRQTYVNQCELSCAALLMPGLRRASVGPCIEDTVDSRCNVDCSEAFVPVCGSDGKTYNSRCHLACKAEHSPADAGLTVYYHAECEQDCLKRCGDLSEPVCGTNEITYQNECYLDCATYRYRNLVVDYNGECVPDYQPCICNFDFSPVCGTDGNTYANQCSLECEAKLQPDIEMECDHKCPCQRQSTIPVPDRRKPQRQCIEACNDLYKPVCGKTISLSPLLRIGACTEYSNECYMAIAACRAENADQRVERCDCPSFS